MNRQKLLAELKALILKDYPSTKIILYGSRSRGDYKLSSDWDILIVINDDLQEREKIEIQNKIYDIELKTGDIINSIIHTEREWYNPLMQATPFFANVKKEGITT